VTGLTIVSLNTRGLPLFGSALRTRYTAIADGFEQSDVDVVNLQEVLTYRHLHLLRRAMPSYRANFRPSVAGPAGGLVTFTRRPAVGVRYRRFPAAPTTAALRRRARIDARLKGLTPVPAGEPVGGVAHSPRGLPLRISSGQPANSVGNPRASSVARALRNVAGHTLGTPVDSTSPAAVRPALFPPIDRLAVLSQALDGASSELNLTATALAERPQLPRRTLILEYHFVGFEDVKFTAAVPIDRLSDPLKQRRQLYLVVGRDLLTRSLTLSFRAHRSTLQGEPASQTRSRKAKART
jgi:hypothetical protein